MRPRSPPPVAIALLVVLAAVAAVPVVDARAPPTPVCSACSVDTTVDGTVVAAGESELTVSIHENGSTTWVERIELTAGSDALAENDSLRRAAVEAAMGRSIADPVHVRSRIGGDTLVVRYRDDGATERHAGAVAFTPLTPEGPGVPLLIGGQGSRYLGTDRFTLQAPPGDDLHGDADSSRSGTLVWTRENGSERRDLDVTEDPVAVDAEAVAPGVRTWFARLFT